MKVDELRTKLAQLDKQNIITLAVEFYKLIPKAKKEGNDLDAFINNGPPPKEAKAAKNVARNIEEIETEVNTFISHAKAQLYLYPNKTISKKDRATWRFKVKAWYKELTDPKNEAYNPMDQAQILTNLYDLMCEACSYEYFSGDNPFASIGIEQSSFFAVILHFNGKARGKEYVATHFTKNVVESLTDYNTSNATLMAELIPFLGTETYINMALETVKEMLEKNVLPVSDSKKRDYYEFDNKVYRKKEKDNKLAELGLRLYGFMYEYEKGIEFYKNHAVQHDEEIKIYILIRILLEMRQREHILTELQSAAANGIVLRSNLKKLMKDLENGKELPQYL